MPERNVVGRSVRVLVGDSVFEDALVTIADGRLFIEFEAEDLSDIMLDLRQVENLES